MLHGEKLVAMPRAALGKEDLARSDHEYALRIDFGPFVPEIEGRVEHTVHKQKAGTDGPL